MKNILPLLFVTLFFSISLISALDIGFVVNNPNSLTSGESAVDDFLKNENHNVDKLIDAPFDADNYNIIIIGESVRDIHSIFDHTNTRTLFMSRSAAKKKAFADHSSVSRTIQARIDSMHYITEDHLTGDIISVYSPASEVEILKFPYANGAINLVSKRDPKEAIILALDIGSELLSGEEITQRNLFFGLTEADNWNNNAKDLFRKSLQWLDNSDNNEPPVIENFSPSSPTNIIENTDTTFSISYTDSNNIDDVTVEWKVDGIVKGNEDNYNFNEAIGNYEVIAVISDGFADVQQTWQVSVMEQTSLTCELQNGDICNSNEICSGDLIDASDSNSCCSNTCTEPNLDFSKADICSTTNSKIDVNLLSVDDEYKVNRDIKFSVRIRNNDNEKYDFNIDTYFYDVTDDKIIKKKSDSVKVKNGESEVVSFTFYHDLDLDESNNYAILAVVQDEICQQEYEEFEITREDHNIIIEDIDIINEYLYCGGGFDITAEVNNIGLEEQDDVVFSLKSRKLDIDLESKVFTLEAAGEDNTEKIKFNIAIPNDVKSGIYTINSEVSYHKDKIERLQKVITLSACGDESVENSISIVEDSSNDLLELGSTEINEDQEGELENDGGSNLFRNIFLIFLLIFAGIAGFVVYNFSNN